MGLRECLLEVWEIRKYLHVHLIMILGRETDAGNGGENWRQIIEEVKEIDSGPGVGRWPT